MRAESARFRASSSLALDTVISHLEREHCARCGWHGSDTLHACTSPLRDTIAQANLGHRGIFLGEDVHAADALCFLAACPFGAEQHPAIVGLMRDIATNQPKAIHRTALRSRFGYSPGLSQQLKGTFNLICLRGWAGCDSNMFPLVLERFRGPILTCPATRNHSTSVEFMPLPLDATPSSRASRELLGHVNRVSGSSATINLLATPIAGQERAVTVGRFLKIDAGALFWSVSSPRYPPMTTPRLRTGATLQSPRWT